MNNLFDNTEKSIKINNNKLEELQIKNVLNPFNQEFIDEQYAKELGIIVNGYYRNCYGGLIPLHIAARKGFIKFVLNDRIVIEYRSKQYSIISNLTIHQVYDNIQQCMISCQQAIDKGYLNLELFLYTNLNLSMEIHEAFYRGLIIGDLQTNVTQPKPIISINEKRDFEYENLFSSLTNIINSLSEFRNTININDECELTSDGFIKQKKTGKCYLLTQAIESGLVSIKDTSIKNQTHQSKNGLQNILSASYLIFIGQSNRDSLEISLTSESTLVNNTMSSTMNTTSDEDGINPYFSDTFMFDLLKPTASSVDEIENTEIYPTNTKRLLPSINTC
ncbi:unnamed protein product [Adineta steineri]|uniref:Uncharacterized protein n=1 Tax=Adineta steineri TaxID=433720 RepID=A0A814AF82_9BILA|nr:unnamed protein product [Adineta steineri]CAF0913627.1 unnamed protein product [Adineta steineri]